MSTWRQLRDNPRLKEIYEARLAITRLIREFFSARGFLEVATPAAVLCADEEPHLNPVPITLRDETGRANRLWLRTSPEYAMKKLLAAGYDKIFQICPCWRDYEESGHTHNNEFTMLEWYRAPGDYEEIMEDIQELFEYVKKRLKIEDLRFKDYKIGDEWEKISVKELFAKHVGVNLDEYLTAEKLKELTSRLGYQVSGSDDYSDLFYKIFLNKIEPYVGMERPTIVYDYPAPLAALARLCPGDARYAERFEVYAGGLELANAFGELTDSAQQAKRFEQEQTERARLGKTPIPIDNGLLNALKFIPTAAGIALGVDRLVMLFTGAKNINEVMFDTVADQLINNN